MANIGEFLRQLRGKMTYREASEKSGLSHSYIRYLEMGKRPGTNTPINPTPETLKCLAKAYNYDYEELMEKAGYLHHDGTLTDSSIESIVKKAGDPGSKERESFAKVFVEELIKLPEDVQNNLYELVKNMPKK